MNDSDWMSTEDVSEEFRVPVATIYQWNYSGTGPPRYRLGRHVRFLRSEVTAWAQSRRVP
jgi:excisionase family DNA binding protein